MRVTYIHHSGFCIELGHSVFFFDYVEDPAGVASSICTEGKNVFFVVSHRHPDHFSPAIFSQGEKIGKAKFILSNDLRKIRHFPVPQEQSDDVFFIKSGESLSFGDVRFNAFPSTDIGISLSVETEGTTIFHAGDLNLWHWKDESTADEIKWATGTFRAALRTIASKHQSFDVAMFPVDARQGSDYEEGARIFLQEFNVKHFFPMHFWDQPATTLHYERYRNPEYGQCVTLQHPGDSLLIE